MHTYHNLKARMKGQAPSNWSPVLKPRDDNVTETVKQFGTGLRECEARTQTGEWKRLVTWTNLSSRAKTIFNINIKNILDGAYERKQSNQSADLNSPSVNETMWQSFEWYTPSWTSPVPSLDAAMGLPTLLSSKAKPASNVLESPSHFSLIRSILPQLSQLGITSLWLPPGCKGTGSKDNGYGIYDLYDLGEFDCKGSRRTKWGSKEELVALGKEAAELGIGLLWDAVLNHRAAADGKEKAKAIVCNPKDRNVDLPGVKNVETWSRFNYPARHGAYSSMTYNWRHFSGIDWDDSTHTKAIFKFVGDERTKKSGWADDVDDELGNYDYLMFADVDYSQPDVQSDVLHWSTWLPTQVPGLTGLRLDAIKHYSAAFQYKLIKHLRDNATTKDWFFVGEYWRADSKFLAKYIDGFAGHMHLFDVKLMYNFSDFSAGRLRDLRQIFKDSLVELKPQHAVTFVTNHDTQATQSLAAPVLSWFIPHAYSLILLRTAGLPCIFHGDVFGTQCPSHPTGPAAGHRLMRLSLVRKLYAYGPQHDYFISRDCVAWSREGHGDHGGGSGLAVVLNSGWKWVAVTVYVGRTHAGETWTDLMGWSWDEIVVDARGWATFRVAPRLVGVWTKKDAVGRDAIDSLIWPPLHEEEDDD